MRRVILLAISTMIGLLSAQAQAAPYVAVQGGLIRAKDNDVDELVDYQTTQSPASPLAPSTAIGREYDDVFSTNYRRGFTVGLAGGYDFGPVRLELELSHKRTGLKDIDADDYATVFLSSVNDELNRPSAGPSPGSPAAAIDDFNFRGNFGVTSAMVNAMVDLDVTKRLSAYLGYGAGRNRVRGLGDTDFAWGWQRFYGVRYKVTDKVELGLKYRKHTSGIIKLQADPLLLSGIPEGLTLPGPSGETVAVTRTTDAMIIPEIEGEFRTHSYLVSLFYNF